MFGITCTRWPGSLPAFGFGYRFSTRPEVCTICFCMYEYNVVQVQCLSRSAVEALIRGESVFARGAAGMPKPALEKERLQSFSSSGKNRGRRRGRARRH
jgi:hypothetical protein